MRSTDNQNEIFDIVDGDDNIIGTATRGKVHKNKNLIHRSIGVAVFNKKEELFLQQRSETKDMDPLLWTISCAGHVGSGDDYETSAHRELIEELGIDLSITLFAKFICRAPRETEMVMLYKAYNDGPFKLNLQEIKKGMFFTRHKLKELVKLNKLKLSFWGKVALAKLGWL